MASSRGPSSTVFAVAGASRARCRRRRRANRTRSGSQGGLAGGGLLRRRRLRGGRLLGGGALARGGLLRAGPAGRALLRGRARGGRLLRGLKGHGLCLLTGKGHGVSSDLRASSASRRSLRGECSRAYRACAAAAWGRSRSQPARVVVGLRAIVPRDEEDLVADALRFMTSLCIANLYGVADSQRKSRPRTVDVPGAMATPSTSVSRPPRASRTWPSSGSTKCWSSSKRTSSSTCCW